MDRPTDAIRRYEIAFQALPSQKKFFRSGARFKGFSGPVGSGKSQALCHEALRLSILNAGRTGLLGAPTYPQLRAATLEKFLEHLKESRVPFEWSKGESVVVLKETKSKVLLRPLSEADALRGTNLAWFGVDELTYAPEASWLQLEARLRDPRAKRLCGFGVWTPNGFDWVYERFLANPAEGYEAVLAKPGENVHLLRKVPDYYERLKRSYDESRYRQEALGEYLQIGTGRVYRSFSRPEHVRPVEASPETPLLWALDFNVDPMSSVVAQRTGGQLVVLDEIVLRRATTREACQEFQARWPRHDAGLRIYADASGHHRHTTGSSDVEILRTEMRPDAYRRVEFRVPKANPPVRDRIATVNAKLKDAGGGIGLMVSPRCKELIKDFEQVVFKEGSVAIDKDRDPRRTHLSDALGYLAWQEFHESGGIGERGKRLL